MFSVEFLLSSPASRTFASAGRLRCVAPLPRPGSESRIARRSADCLRRESCRCARRRSGWRSPGPGRCRAPWWKSAAETVSPCPRAKCRGRCRKFRSPPRRHRFPARVDTRNCRIDEPSIASAALSIRFAITRRINSASAFTGGSVGASSVRSVMPSSRPRKSSSALVTIEFRSAGASLAAGKRANCENSSTSDSSVCTSRSIKPAHSAASFSNSVRALAELRCRRAVQIAQQALRGKLNRRQRILDLVRDALRHFLPGRGFLRAQQVGQIVDHHDESGIRPRAARAS